ncbi:uncharacterized protein MELLADRAFT_117365 [Melampsora larici-populina 98AG31]|uniref:Uncharacterized protein n=1 Tax=Melampsora larici-populina (strain 98AG31 / pathotype 3-4-7) TaxID=747676 RepID=F4RWF9_MELLP|nr:uncharacterized protein MELLADRAFT_117365 [Melampsora larici-populina 98AG31]EGG03327.1 hypothetical protein MELLADRAFT_117365 [Melampsora larici-populina 98AG31]
MTISALPSLRQPESIHPEFYYTSDSFIIKIKHDINLLISTFKSSSSTSSSLGPFLNFKSIYKHLGWNLIHLSVIDSSLRKVWFNTIIRLFLDYLKPQVDPIEQIAALFSIYTFWGTQSAILDTKFNVIIDLNMLNYIKSIPKELGTHLNESYQSITDQLSTTTTTTPIQPIKTSLPKSHSHLDPSLFSARSSKPNRLLPSHSLYQIVTNLIQQNAFIIQPIETALVYPNLPTNSFVLESTLNPLSLSHLHRPSTYSTSSKVSFSEHIVSTQDELERWKESNWTLSDLREIRSQYLLKKSKLIEDHVEFDSIFLEAIRMTLQVIEKNGPGLNHLLESSDPVGEEQEGVGKDRDEEVKKQIALKAIRLQDSGESLEEWDEALNSLRSSGFDRYLDIKSMSDCVELIFGNFSIKSKSKISFDFNFGERTIDLVVLGVVVIVLGFVGFVVVLEFVVVVALVVVVLVVDDDGVVVDDDLKVKIKIN